MRQQRDSSRLVVALNVGYKRVYTIYTTNTTNNRVLYIYCIFYIYTGKQQFSSKMVESRLWCYNQPTTKDTTKQVSSWFQGQNNIKYGLKTIIWKQKRTIKEEPKNDLYRKALSLLRPFALYDFDIPLKLCSLIVCNQLRKHFRRTGSGVMVETIVIAPPV